MRRAIRAGEAPARGDFSPIGVDEGVLPRDLARPGRFAVMVPDQQRLSIDERSNLVAYLDGELNDAQTRAIATKLTQSLTARREVEALQKTWEMLDLLPRPKASED